jgi:prefoldin subunit 5
MEELRKEIRQLREQLERLERTVATLRRKIYNSLYETREIL